jgi:hypothetical protein
MLCTVPLDVINEPFVAEYVVNSPPLKPCYHRKFSLIEHLRVEEGTVLPGIKIVIMVVDFINRGFEARKISVAISAQVRRTEADSGDVLRGGRRPEPNGQGIRETLAGLLANPGDIAVGTNQDCGGSGDFSEQGKFPGTVVLGIDEADAAGPGSDVEAAGLAEIEQHRLGRVEQCVDAVRAVGGDQVKVGHASTEEWVPVAEIVVDIEAGHHGGILFTRLIHLQEFGGDLPCGSRAIIAAHQGDLCQRVPQNLCGDRVALGLVGIEQGFG